MSPLKLIAHGPSSLAHLPVCPTIGGQFFLGSVAADMSPLKLICICSVLPHSPSSLSSNRRTILPRLGSIGHESAQTNRTWTVQPCSPSILSNHRRKIPPVAAVRTALRARAVRENLSDGNVLGGSWRVSTITESRIPAKGGRDGALRRHRP